MEALIARYGLIIIFLGAAIEGDVTMLLGGVTVHLGIFELPAAVAVGALGGFAGDVFLYGLGRWHSAAIRDSRLYRRAEPAIARFTARFGPLQIVPARFVYGTRIASMVFWGVQRLPVWQFLLIDALGCALWAVALGCLGYTLSGSAALIVGHMKRVQLWLVAGLVGCVALVLLVRAILKRRARQRARTAAAGGLDGPPATRPPDPPPGF